MARKVGAFYTNGTAKLVGGRPFLERGVIRINHDGEAGKDQIRLPALAVALSQKGNVRPVKLCEYRWNADIGQ